MNQRASKQIRDILTDRNALVVYAWLSCMILALLCISFANHSHYVSIWVVNAILLIFIFRSPATLTWAYFAAGLIANILVNYLYSEDLQAALILSACNSIEILLPILMVKRQDNAPIYIKGLNHQSNFLALSVLMGCAISSIMATAYTIAGINRWFPTGFAIAFNWFTIDLLAMVTILPLGLSITHDRCHKLLHPKKIFELIIVMIFTVAVTLESTNYIQIKFIVMLMPLLYAAFRLGLLGTAIIFISTVCTYIANILSHSATNQLYENMIETISFSFLLMCITLVPALITAILIEQRDDFEEKLKEDEQRFRGAMQYSALGVALVSPEGRWMLVNPALCEITGYSADELMKLTFHEITHPTDRARDLDLIAKLNKREIPSYNIEKRWINKNGEVVWISLIVSAVFDSKNNVVYYVTQSENITTRKRMETALQESEHRWKFALEGGNQGVWDWDITGHIIYYSRTWKFMLGYNDNEISNSPDEWFSRIHPEDKEMVMLNLNQHLSGTTDKYQCEHRMRCKDDSYKWFLGRGRVITRLPDDTAARIIGTSTDIDAIKNAEAETERLSQRLQIAINAGKMGIFDLDIENNYLSWDDRMFELYDVSKDNFSHNYQAWEDRIHPEDYQRTAHEFRQALNSNKNLDTEFRIITPKGQIRWIRAKAQVLRNNLGKAVTMLGMNWDITSEKKMVHDLFTEKERLSTTLNAIGDAVIVTDEAGIISFINPIAEQLIGCNASVAVGKNLYDICKIISESTGELLENPIAACLKNKEIYYFKEGGILINHIGARYFIQNSAAPIILPTGEVVGSVLVLQDVTINRNLQAELKHQATHDVLTGLINRREFELKIRSLINDERQTIQSNSLFFIDLDNFKSVNDSAGHAAGDELLRRIAELFTQTVRETDTVVRLGGDEFAIILPDCTVENATSIARTLIDKIKQYRFLWENKSYEIGLSIGIVNFKPKQISLEALLSRADIACYTAKSHGGNHCTISTST